MGLGVVGDGFLPSSGVGRDVGSSGAWLVGEGVASPGSSVGTSGASVGGFVLPGPFVGADVSTSPHSGEQQSHSTSEHSTESILQSSFSALAMHTSSGIDPSRLLPSNLATAIEESEQNNKRRNECGQLNDNNENKTMK